MGAGVMCARAIVRDLYRPVEGARMMSKGLTGLGVIACLSGPLGGLLSGWIGWRIALLALAVFALLALVLPLTLSGYGTYNDWGDVLGGDWLE